MPAATVNVDALYAALDHKRSHNKRTWRDLAEDLEISPSTFTRMANGLRPDTDTFATLLQWLDMPASEFTTSNHSTSEEEEPLAAIASFLRSSHKLSREEADALDRIITAAYESIVKE